ncbi:MAG TPA: chemotaxis protein CheW [Gemmatimonadales bacterium]|nr:chemotaxis protein CheW [Gemmatimonadales bacterium]
MSASWLLVRVGSRRVGLSLADVVEVLDPGAVYPVPAQEPAVRGVTTAREEIMPLVHLGALLDGTGCPARRGGTTVLVRVDGRPLCLEVDDAEEVLSEAGHPVPVGSTLPFAAAVARLPEGLVPLLDLTALVTRISETTSA